MSKVVLEFWTHTNKESEVCEIVDNIIDVFGGDIADEPIYWSIED